MTDTPYVYRTTTSFDDPYLRHLMDIAAEERCLIAIQSSQTEMTLTYYDPATMPRSPSIWGQSERFTPTWPDFMADDGPMLA